MNGKVIAREPRRTSFTFRQARGFPCDCAYPSACDSQQSPVPPTRKMQLLMAAAEGKTQRCEQASAPARATPVAGGSAQTGCAGEQRQEGDKEEDAALRKLEEAHVHRVYNAIAPHFSATRSASTHVTGQAVGAAIRSLKL